MSPDSSSILTTKLYTPPLHPGLVQRPRLLQWLDEGLRLGNRVTLVSAPAGYGKTTLVAEWLHCKAEGVAWLTLDEGDNDPALFLAYLIEALRSLDQTCGSSVQALLAGSLNPATQVRPVFNALINDILQVLPDPFTLILDDLHLIAEPTIHIALEYLVERLPPQMRLILTTRHDPPLPLARWRARGQLAELRLPDLQFTLDESTAFLNSILHLDLSPGELATLHTCTEGWPAGLRLLAFSLERVRRPVDRAALITDLTRADRLVFDFLAQEVLDHEREAVRTFLLQTSILSELTPALCQAVTGQADTSATLEDLERRNLFLIAMDPARTTFRYHALFAKFLQQQLARETPERVKELHGRVAQAQTAPEQAIAHYLAAEMWREAAQRIEQVGKTMLQQGRLVTLENWIGALPPEVCQARPWLDWLLGSCAAQKGDSRAALAPLERALRGFEQTGATVEQGEALAILVSATLLQGDLERLATLLAQALPVCSQSTYTRVQLLLAGAWLALFQGDWGRVQASVEEALEIATTSDERTLLMTAFCFKPDLAVFPGALNEIERFCRQADVHLEKSVSPLRLAIEELLCFAHLWRGRLEEAIHTGEDVLRIRTELGGHLFLGLEALAFAGDAAAARGDHAISQRFYDAVFEQAQLVPFALTRLPSGLYPWGRILWQQNRIDEVRGIYAQLCALTGIPQAPDVPARHLMMRALLEMAERRYAAAEPLLQEAVDLEDRIPLVRVFGSARVLLAHLYLETDRPRDALGSLSPVLDWCEREDVPGVVLREGRIVIPLLRAAVEYGVHPALACRLLALLDAPPEPSQVVVPETGKTLTPREVEVLALLAVGCSNRAIAEKLVISLHTVKSHVAHILCKLGVSSRTQAVVRARELGISPRL